LRGNCETHLPERGLCCLPTLKSWLSYVSPELSGLLDKQGLLLILWPHYGEHVTALKIRSDRADGVLLMLWIMVHTLLQHAMIIVHRSGFCARQLRPASPPHHSYHATAMAGASSTGRTTHDAVRGILCILVVILIIIT
jgi:hypothetical protein